MVNQYHSRVLSSVAHLQVFIPAHSFNSHPKLPFVKSWSRLQDSGIFRYYRMEEVIIPNEGHFLYRGKLSHGYSDAPTALSGSATDEH